MKDDANKNPDAEATPYGEVTEVSLEDRLNGMVNSPVMRAIREQQRLFQDIVDPPVMRAIREQAQRLQDLVDPPALRAIRNQQQRMRVLIASWGRVPLAKSEFAQYAGAFSSGAPAVARALREARLDMQAQAAELAASGITKLLPLVGAPGSQRSVELLSAGVEFLASPFDDAPADLVADMPSEVFRALDVDTSFSGAVEHNAESERVELRSNTSAVLEIELVTFDPELVRLLAGARSAAQSNNPDRIRHVCISLRELLGHALRQLAPDSTIQAWSKDPIHYHDTKPTRKARLEFLYKDAAVPALRKLIDADIRSALELFDTLSNGTHSANLAASEEALIVLLNRAEGVLLLMLRLHLHGVRGV